MSETKTLLLELHCEEIPARFLKPLTEELWPRPWAGTRRPSQKQLALLRWRHSMRPSDTLLANSPGECRGICPAAVQPDQSETQVGPPQRMCVDENGQPTQTGLKFAEKWGVDFGAVRFEQPAGKKEPCAVVTLTKQGRPTVELLAEALPRLIAGLHVPKAMRWGNSEFEFVRPIRNILCLFGEEVVPFEVDGVSRPGHHLGPSPLPLRAPRARGHPVASKPTSRRWSRPASWCPSTSAGTRIAADMKALAAEVGGRVVADEELLDTLAEIVEFPRVVRGQFPADVHGPAQGGAGDLPQGAPEVLLHRERRRASCCPSSSPPPTAPTIPRASSRAGNEWVLKARLYDARFFFEEDRRSTPSSDRLESLKHLTFHRELGSYFEKTERIVVHRRGSWPSGLDLDAEQATGTRPPAACKCDLRTLMVGEFPELQGVMGGEYLRHEQRPGGRLEGREGALPAHRRRRAHPRHGPGLRAGRRRQAGHRGGLLRHRPDPQRLQGSPGPAPGRRRASCASSGSRAGPCSPLELCRMALQGRGRPGHQARSRDHSEALESFFRDRVAYQLEVAGYAGAVRRSALPVGWTNLVDLKARCEALSAFAEDARFASLAQSAKRIGNILKDEVACGRLRCREAPGERGEGPGRASRRAWKRPPTTRALLADLAELAGPWRPSSPPSW